MQRAWGAHAVDRRVGGCGDPGRAAGHPVLRPRAGGGALVVRRRTRSLVGARVLVVGAGDIGPEIGRMLAGFDVELTYVARTAREGVRSTADLPELLPDADVVIVIVPVTPETTGMVDAGFLAAMPDGALLVNAARGVVVDTDALVAELTRAGCGPRWTSPNPSRCRRGIRCGRRRACCSRRTWGVRSRRPTPAPPRRSPSSWRGCSPASSWRTSSTAIDRAAGGDVDPATGELRQAGQVAGAHNRHAHLGAAGRDQPEVAARADPDARELVPRHPSLPGAASARSVRRRRCPPRPAAPRRPGSGRSSSTGVHGAGSQRHHAQRQEADGDQGGPVHPQAGGGVHGGPCSHPRPMAPGGSGLPSPIVTTVEDRPAGSADRTAR